MTKKAKNVCDFIDNIDTIDDEVRMLRIENERLQKINNETLTELNHINADLVLENERLKKQTEWHYDEPTESKNNFYVILKNGNHRICYWDLISKADKCLKNVVNGEHIAFNFIRCWKEIELPKEMQM